MESYPPSVLSADETVTLRFSVRTDLCTPYLNGFRVPIRKFRRSSDHLSRRFEP